MAAMRDRIPLATSVKGFGVEAAWSASDVRKVAEEVSGLPHAAPGGDHRPPSDKSVELAHIEPGAGVLNAFLDVEREVGRYLSRARVPWHGSPDTGAPTKRPSAEHQRCGPRVGILA